MPLSVRVIVLLCAPLLATWPAPSAGAAPRVVPVPDAPPDTSVVELTEVWRVALGGDFEPLFGTVANVVSLSYGRLLVVDRQLDRALLLAPGGRVTAVYGQHGEGPGDLKSAWDACALDDGRVGVLEGAPAGGMVMTNQALEFFEPDGDPAGRATFAPEGCQVATLRGVRSDGRRLLVGVTAARVSPPRIHMIQRVVLTDAYGQERLRPLDRVVTTRFDDPAAREEDEFTHAARGRFDLAADGRWAVLPERDAYVVLVGDAGGPALRLVGEARGRPRTAAEKAALVARFGAPSVDWRPADATPVLAAVRFRPDGELWVQPWPAEPRGGAFGAWDAFDRDGRLLRRVEVRAPGDPARDRLVPLADGTFALIVNDHAPFDADADADADAGAAGAAGQTLVVLEAGGGSG